MRVDNPPVLCYSSSADCYRLVEHFTSLYIFCFLGIIDTESPACVRRITVSNYYLMDQRGFRFLSGIFRHEKRSPDRDLVSIVDYSAHANESVTPRFSPLAYTNKPRRRESSVAYLRIRISSGARKVKSFLVGTYTNERYQKRS